MKQKKIKEGEESGKSTAEWTDLKEFIQRKKTQNKVLKKIIDRINEQQDIKENDNQ